MLQKKFIWLDPVKIPFLLTSRLERNIIFSNEPRAYLG